MVLIQESVRILLKNITVMKRLAYILLLMAPLGMNAQDMYQTAPFMENDITGTSRFISMGGSMGALGGDMSVMGTNPAGIGLYRSTDIAISGSMNFNRAKANYNGNVVKSNKTSFDLENFGAVLACRQNDGGPMKFFNVGIGYRRKNGLSRDFAMAGPSLGYSQQYAIRYLYDNNPFSLSSADYKSFEGLYYSWLPLLATYANIGDTDGNLITRPDGSLIYEPTDVEFVSEERGGTSEVDFNFATNFNDRFYFGATVSLVNVDYSRNTVYYEYDDQGEIYSLGNYNDVEGTGVNIKIGAILRPFKYSPFRLGFAVHTPTWYNLRNYSYADISGPFGDFYDTRDYELYYDVLDIKSKLNTPWRFTASAAYTFGNYLALNVDYEYADYTTANYRRSAIGSRNNLNEEIECNMDEQHTVRVGAECNLGSGFSLRGGYVYSSAPMKTTAFKEMMNMPVTSTSTEFENRYDKEMVTLGLGYRGKIWYFDMAYALQIQKSDFYPYCDPDVMNPAAKVDYTDHSVTATLGMKF